MRDDGEICALIKPQFEAGRESVGKKGVVRDPKVHENVINSVAEYAGNIGLSILGLTYSPVKGPEGNIEYLIHLKKSPDGKVKDAEMFDPAYVVEESHNELE